MSTPLPGLAGLLFAAGPANQYGDKMDLYGRLIGSWDLVVDFTFLDGSRGQAIGEAHFAWVLEGRAIQDVFIIPARRLRTDPEHAESWYRYGSTFRWYDPAIDAWHIIFFDPARRVEQRQIGRAVGTDIVQMDLDRGALIRRWRFTDITADSFRWLGEMSWDNGSAWTRELEMHARRAKPGRGADL